MAEEKQNFANSGEESFKMKDVSTDKESAQKKIILNIADEENNGIVLGDAILKKRTIKLTGNFFVDTFTKINNYFIEHSSIKIGVKSNFYHLLSVMINSGIPTVESLRAIVPQLDESPKLQMIASDLVEDIEGGASFSASMLKFPEAFDEKEIGMVQAGEASGQIANVLENLSIDTQKAYEIRGKIKSAMIYPVVIFTLLIVVVIGMMVFVVPRLTSLFASVQTQLPLITRIVVGLSNFLINGKFILIGSVIAIIVIFKALHKTDLGRYYWDLFKLRVPMFGKMYQKAYLARFSRTLSNLLNSGLSIVTTLQINANSMGNEVYRRRILLAMEDIKQGLALAESLTESYLFPSMLIHMIDVGEKTAQLDDMMLKVAHFYENELDNTIAGLSKILEPLILVFIGITVGGVVAAIMLPILQLSTLSDKL